MLAPKELIDMFSAMNKMRNDRVGNALVASRQQFIETLNTTSWQARQEMH
jgi:hypothetical protein